MMLQILPFRARELTEWFNQCKEVGNDMPSLFQSRDPNAIEHQWVCPALTEQLDEILRYIDLNN